MPGWVLDLILAGMVLEGAAFALLWHTRRRGIPPGALLPNLAAGMALLLAMRLAMAGVWWGWTGLSLSAALVCHLIDIRRRTV